jgi:hypothetical protein
MTFGLVTWLFVAAVAAHNAEEAIWLPTWSKTASKWHPPVTAIEFRFATAVLTLLAILAGALAGRGSESAGAYLVAGYALAMLLNVLFPHLLATLALRRYMPGTATAVLLTMPASAALLWKASAGGYIDAQRFLWTGPATVLGIALSIPLLFWLGRRLLQERQSLSAIDRIKSGL